MSRTFQCSMCQKVKPLREFDNNKGYKRGHHYNCKPCRHKLYKKHYYQRHYGVDQQFIEQLKKKQRYRCKLCGNKRKLVLDHDHNTDYIRGLLCTPCNVRLGWFENRKNKILKYIGDK
jgi:hypothetical protein